MLFALICTDKPDSLDLRMAVRPDHVKFLESLGRRMKACRPLPRMQMTSPIGSLVIIEAADRARRKPLQRADPYAKAGLFASVDIRAWKWTMKNPEAM